MSEDKGSYRQIFKATSLFGGVQVFNIILSIIRSKIVAILLGPAGMGVAGLFTSATTFIGNLTNFGLGVSAVRNVAAANQSGDHEKITKVVTVLRRLVWGTGLLGMLLTLVLAPWLSKISFGNNHYTIAFAWLSLSLLFTQLTSGQDTLLQGMRRLQDLAKANMFGAVFGLLVSVPLYYFFRVDGIAPAIIASSLITTVIAWFYARKINLPKINISTEDTVNEGKDMLTMGFLLSLSSLISAGTSYIVRIYIRNDGGIEDVGLYNAGFTIIITYVGLVFTAMSTDYYPRLSGVADDNKKAAELINQQAEAAVLILAPILCVFLVFIREVVVLLYSDKFLPVNGMLHWAALGMYFRAVSWSVGFVFLAKGDTKVFFWNQVVANVLLLGLNVWGYKFYGLEGLGISFMVAYAAMLLWVYLIARYKYRFSFYVQLYKIFAIQFSFGLLSFIVIRFLSFPLNYLIGIVIIILCAIYTFVEMDKRLDLKSQLAKFRKPKS